MLSSEAQQHEQQQAHQQQQPYYNLGGMSELTAADAAALASTAAEGNGADTTLLNPTSVAEQEFHMNVQNEPFAVKLYKYVLCDNDP